MLLSLDAAVHELGHAVADSPDVLERCTVHAVFIQTTATHVTQEAGRSRKQHVISQHHGAFPQQPVVLQSLQVRQVTPLPVVHEHKIQPLNTEIFPQTRNHFIRGAHDQLDLQEDRVRGQRSCS